MDVIEGVSVGPMTPESQFVRPLRMYYKQNKVDKVWDLVSLHDSVCVILFNTDRQKVVLVRQFRPGGWRGHRTILSPLPPTAVYYNGVSVEERQALGGCVDTAKHPGKDGLTLELCAGIVDKQLSLAEVAQLEALEECGYNVPVEKFEHVKTCRAGVGVSGDRMTMFYAEVTDAMKESEGGGLEAEGEMIEVVEMGLPEVKEFLAAPEVTAPSGLLFGLTWFLYNKAPGVSTSTTTTNT